MTPALDIGGVLSIRCPTCGEERGNECRTAPTSPGGFRVTRPHAARVKAAPPIVEAHVGDLVLVRHRGEHVVQLVEIGTVLSVRFWRPSAQVFASPRLLEREAVIGLAPDDARTDLARAELRLEGERRALIGAPCDIEIEGRRAAGFVTKLDEHGRPAEVEMFDVAPDIAEGRGPFDPGPTWADDLRDCRVCGNPANRHAEGDGFEIHEDGVQICDGFEPVDPKRPPRPEAEERIEALRPGQSTSDPPDAPPDPWFTSDSAETTAPPKGW